MERKKNRTDVENTRPMSAGESKIIFQKLTPTSEVDLSVYEDAINYIFDNSDITNAALSGPYSAGKSSVIEAYKKKNSDKKFMHISLAHFEKLSEGEKKIKESVLEGKILNQLIHQIPVDLIPQTNFRIKKDNGNKKICKITALISLILLNALYIFKFSKMKGFVHSISNKYLKFMLSALINDYVILLAGLIFIICCVIGIYNIVKVQKEKNLFHKVSLNGNEIEIFEKQEDSYFDKYLNEVLYLFEKVNADVIVFEDMDRFNGNSIFERLREINRLVNVLRQNQGNQMDNYEPLRFIYLLRDDIFATKDRTKFFDYIIPIVPVLDGSNSHEQFVKFFKEAEVINKFDESFLQRLSLYIDDMRILKNIYNEFMVYINRLNNTDLNWDKMLAIIVYKNVFPKDFCDLQLGRGYVHEVFNQKDNIIEKTVESLQEKSDEISKKIDLVKKEILISKDEIDAAYTAKHDKLPRDYYNRLTKESAEKWEQLQKEKEIRLNGIENTEFCSDLEKNLRTIEKDISFAKSRTLVELITREISESVFLINYVNPIGKTETFNNIKGNEYFDLLKYLISSGYLDETYSDYMSYFYEGSFSKNDKTFLRRITDRRGADFEYKLDNAYKVLMSPILRIIDFSEEETLNYDLISTLVLNQSNQKCKEYFKVLVEQLKEKGQFEFIRKYYDSEGFNEKFIELLNIEWPEFFSIALKNKELSQEKIRQYSLDSLKLSNVDTLLLVDVDGCLKDYISGLADYLKIDTVNNKIKESIKVLNVSFEKIDYDSSNKELFEAVYEESMYALNFDNIALMLTQKYGITNFEDIIHKNYSMVLKQEESPLALYVDENFGMYLNQVVSNCEGDIRDEEVAILNILNSSLLDEEIKKQYISVLSSQIVEINKAEDTTLWNLLIEGNNICTSINNIVEYFNKFEFTETLAQYIDAYGVNLDFSTFEEEFGKEVTNRFFNCVTASRELSVRMYRKILCELNLLIESVDDNLQNEKMEVLIDEGILQMNVDSLECVREYYPELVNSFVEKNLDMYIDIQDSISSNLEEVLYILGIPVDDGKKIELLSYTSEPISMFGGVYSDKVKQYILIHNLMESDLERCLLDYREFSELIQGEIYGIAIKMINVILERKIQLDDTLLSELITKSSLKKSVKISLWGNSLPYSNEEICKTHFDELEVPELKGIFTKRNVTRKYDISSETTAILKVLKENTWIYDYYAAEDDSEKYVIVKNPPK